MPATNIKRVYNLIILDESGSMHSIKEPIVKGFNDIILSIGEEARKDPDLEQWINFYSFNGSGLVQQIPLSRVDQFSEVKGYNYQPQDNTPLYDAIGHSCNKLLIYLENKKDFSVLVTILTDGYENASREYSFEAVVKLIVALKEKGWVFTYIGANHNVEETAVKLKISNNIELNTSPSGVNDFVDRDKKARSAFYGKLKNGMTDKLHEDYFDED